MFLNPCWKADKESYFNRCLVPGLRDLVAVNDETVFHCLTAWLALIIIQAAADPSDVMSEDGNEDEMVH